MNVPFDNLYEYIAGEHQDAIIYRWYPHGSKNLRDLGPVDDRYRQLARLDWQVYNRMIPVVCHDQEPLHFELYEQPDWSVLSESTKTMLNHDPDLMRQWCQAQNLFYAVDSSLTDRPIILHSERNSSQVDKYQSYAVPAYWWSHAAIARDWYRFAELDHRVQQLPDVFEHDFNIYARAWSGTRQYRLTFLSLLSRQRLLDQCRITFAHRDGAQHFADVQFDNAKFFVDHSLGNIVDSDVDATASSRYDPVHVRQCGVDVVLETLFDDARIHLTEKVLRSVACGKPFVLLAPAGSLQYLRHYGFRTFDGIIDETYDTMTDALDRMQAVTAEMSRISALSTDHKQQFYRRCQDITDHNRRHFFSSDFMKLVFGELNHNLDQAKQQVRQHWQHGDRWLQRLKLLYSMHPRSHRQSWKHHAPCDVKQMADFLRGVRRLKTESRP
jgi:hypothetical protein